MPNLDAARIHALLDKVRETLLREERAPLAQQVQAAQERLRQSTVSILVCGEFKRGKSSLINALIGNPGLCPVDIDIATAAVSVIRFKESPTATRHFGHVGAGQQEPISLEDLPEYVKQRDSETYTWLLEIGIPSPVLKNGWTLIDTPGLGGLDPRHGFLTRYFLPRADVVLFTMDAEEPLSEPECQFLREQLAERTRQLIIVINKTDCVTDVGVLLEDTRQKVAETLGCEREAVAVVPVSSMCKLDYLKNGDDDSLRESNFSVLHEMITMATHQVLNQNLETALSEALGALQDVLLPLRICSEEFAERITTKRVAALRQHLAEEKARLTELQNPNAQWRNTLMTRLGEMKRQVLNRVREENINLTAQSRLQRMLREQPELMKDPNAFMKALQGTVQESADVIDEHLLKESKDLAEELQDQVSLSFTHTHLEGTLIKSQDGRLVEVQEPTMGKKLMVMARNMFFGGMVAKFAITTLNPAIGIAAGVYALYQSARMTQEALTEERIRAVLGEVQPELQKITLALAEYVEEHVKQIGETFRTAIEHEVERARLRHDEVAKALEAVNRESAEARKQHEKLVKTRIEPIEQLIKYIDRYGQQLGMNTAPISVSQHAQDSAFGARLTQ